MIKEKRVELKCKQTKNYCDLKLKVDEKHWMIDKYYSVIFNLLFICYF